MLQSKSGEKSRPHVWTPPESEDHDLMLERVKASVSAKNGGLSRREKALAALREGDDVGGGSSTSPEELERRRLADEQFERATGRGYSMSSRNR